MRQQSIVYRFWQYLRERFPLTKHGLLIIAFTFSAIAYSRVARGLDSFISLQDFAIGILTNLSFFFLLRVFDEFKDKEEDKKYRAYLPVPRGLISLKELGLIAVIVCIIQLATIVLFQREMLVLYGFVWFYMLLMRYEFFIKDWLKSRQVAYVISHMAIIPIIDLYSSGLDWRLSSNSIHSGIYWFIALSFFNGIVLEIGRKLRAVEHEEEGVISYSKLFGIQNASITWISLLTLTMLIVLGAIHHANLGSIEYLIIGMVYTICLVPAIRYYRYGEMKDAKSIEHFSGIWTIVMYLTLGGVVPLLRIFFS